MKLRRPYPTLAVALAALSVFMALPSLCFAQTPGPLPAEPTVLTQILGALSGGHYLGLIMIATLYLRKLASPSSKFPLNVPTQWLPSVTAFGGLVYGFEASLQAGQGAGAAALQALAASAASGFFDGLLTAFFNHGAAPKWAQAIVFLVDDVAGGTGGGATGGGAVATGGSLRAVPPPPPGAPAAKLAIGAATALACMVFCGTLPGCNSSVWDTLVNDVKSGLENGSVLTFLEGLVVQLFPSIANVAADVDMVLQSVIDMLLNTNSLTPNGRANAQALKPQISAKLAAAKTSGWVPSSAALGIVASLDRKARDPGEVLRPEVARLVDAVKGRVQQ